MTEPDFTDMPFALAQVIDTDVHDLNAYNHTAEPGLHVRVWPNFHDTDRIKPHTVAVVLTLAQAYAVRDKVCALVRTARRLTGNVPP